MLIFFCFPSLVVYMSPSCVIIARLAMTVLHHVSSVIVKWTRILLMTLKEENKKFPVLSPFDRINCFIKCGNQLHAIIIEQSKHHKNACPHWCELTFQFSFVHISFFSKNSTNIFYPIKGNVFNMYQPDLLVAEKRHYSFHFRFVGWKEKHFSFLLRFAGQSKHQKMLL